MPFTSIWLDLGLALTSIIGNYRLTLIQKTANENSELLKDNPYHP